MPQAEKTLPKPLRLWPGVAIVVIQWLLRFVLPTIWPEKMIFGVLGSLACAFLLVVWWAFFSRARISERFGAIGLMIAAGFVTYRFLDVSIATGGQRMLFLLLVTPGLCLAFVVWAMVTRRLADGIRWATMAAAILLACGFWTLLRTGGFNSNLNNDLMWRWAKTPEERLLTQADDTSALPASPVAAKPAEEAIPAAPAPKEISRKVLPTGVADKSPADAEDETSAHTEKESSTLSSTSAKTNVIWPGFRGPNRDGAVRGVQIQTDWTASPPVELWRRPIGPGWSSFAVGGDLLYTQEQRGEEEIVACYSVITGKPIWKHRDAARFWESNAGPGPRGTPSLSNGRVYAMGATGIVNALDARTGAVIWSRNAAADTGAKRPDWGFASSPWVAGDMVVVAASGRLVAYDLVTGKPKWSGPAGGASYSSPRLVEIDGVPQILLVSAVGISSVSPADGSLLWQHQWKGYPIVQPALTADGDILISVTESSGTRRLGVGHGPDGWKAEERWTSNGLKPYFNDFVIHKGHAFGFDGRILSCIDLADGRRKWKGGRYGQGQLLLLPDQDLLLVLSEDGELALVKASSDQFTEVAHHPAIEGKTWNHPVLAGNVLLVRNGQEMAAFRLALENR